MIINRPAVIIVPPLVISEINVIISRQPTSIYPSVAASVIFPISRNPISAHIRNHGPMSLYPNIFTITIIPCPISFYPYIIGTGSAQNRHFNG
jgi:hypothetical protein